MEENKDGRGSLGRLELGPELGSELLFIRGTRIVVLYNYTKFYITFIKLKIKAKIDAMTHEYRSLQN